MGSYVLGDVASDAVVSAISSADLYEAIVRISQGLSCCRNPQQFAKSLANELGQFVSLDHLDIAIFKENSNDIEWLEWGKGGLSFPKIPAEEILSWHAYYLNDALHIADWSVEQRFPRLSQSLADAGVKIGSTVRLPLTTPHRRLGTLGVASYSANAYISWAV